MPKHLGSTSISSSPMTTNATPSTSHIDFEQKVTDALEIWRRSHCRDEEHRKRGEKKTKSVHVESNKDELDITQTSTPATPATIPKSIALMTEQEHVIHQLIMISQNHILMMKR
ncbi:hypothetical protein J1N35_022621, partial [Gossypium stocksii]